MKIAALPHTLLFLKILKMDLSPQQQIDTILSHVHPKVKSRQPQGTNKSNSQWIFVSKLEELSILYKQKGIISKHLLIDLVNKA